MDAGLTRAQLIASAAAIVCSPLLAPSAAAADAAGALPPSDLAYARLLIAFELLAIDFYGNALRSRHLSPTAVADVQAALNNEFAHRAYLTSVIAAAGAAPLTAADVNFAYPKRAFYTAASVKHLALELETLTVGAYLGAAGNVATPMLASALAQITANEAQHQAAIAALDRRAPFHQAFPPLLTMQESSDALSRYTS